MLVRALCKTGRGGKRNISKINFTILALSSKKKPTEQKNSSKIVTKQKTARTLGFNQCVSLLRECCHLVDNKTVFQL